MLRAPGRPAAGAAAEPRRAAQCDVDMDKLVDLAQRGVPPAHRAEVWKYLMRISDADRGAEVSRLHARVAEFEQLVSAADASMSPALDSQTMRRIRAEAKRYVASNAGVAAPLEGDDAAALIARMVEVYLHCTKSAVYVPGLIHVCGMCMAVVYAQRQHEPSDVYFLFKGSMEYLERSARARPVRSQVLSFMALVRHLLPDLHAHFESEELDPNRWATSWLQFRLVSELPLNCVLRLWDAYLAMSYRCAAAGALEKNGCHDLDSYASAVASDAAVRPSAADADAAAAVAAVTTEDASDLHIYLCVAILAQCKDTLEELEAGEILSWLQHLPAMDTDQLLASAQAIREEAVARHMI